MRRKYSLVLFAVFICSLLMFRPQETHAAGISGEITRCALVSKTGLQVNVSLPGSSSLPGDKLYLFSTDYAAGTITTSMKPIATVNKSTSAIFRVSAKTSTLRKNLYNKFVVAVRENSGAYSAVTKPKYISNPDKLAKYTYAFPQTTSKKGLQVKASMMADAIELNVQHAAVNIVLTDMVAPASARNKSASYRYRYQGKTYWITKSSIHSYDAQIEPLKETGAVVSAILLLSYRSDMRSLISPGGRSGGHYFYMWNMSEPSARQTLQACIAFLAERYSKKNGSHGRIVNWIVGNEVNDVDSNYGGKMSLAAYAASYSRAFRMVYNTVSSVYSQARVYISLNHLWNYKVKGAFTAKQMLDSFAAAIKAEGNIPWNVAYHPYSFPLTDPKFWKNDKKQVTSSVETTPVINMGNISLLSKYLRSKYGPGTRLILSEQGYTSVENKKKNTQKEQSAAIVYSYLLTEADSQIDSFIMNRHVDHQVEVAQGLNLGVWNTSGTEWASTKKDSWTAFKYMDTDQSPAYTQKYLSVIGAKEWGQLVPTYSQKLYSKNTVKTGAALTVGSYRKKASVKQKWKAYGATGGRKKKGSSVTVTHASGANPNVNWGVSQSFSALSFAQCPNFYTTVKVTGETSGNATLKIRFYSGNNHIFECERYIPCGKPLKICVCLGEWAYRGNVTKIQILANKAKGSWKNGATLNIRKTVRG